MLAPMLISLSQDQKTSPLDFLKDRNPNSMFLAPVTPQEIEIITRSLNTKKNQLAHIAYPYFYLRFLADILLSPWQKL